VRNTVTYEYSYVAGKTRSNACNAFCPATHLTLRKQWCAGAAGESPTDGKNMQLIGTEAARGFRDPLQGICAASKRGVGCAAPIAMQMGAYTETITIE
jgi:hypothetical protein